MGGALRALYWIRLQPQTDNLRYDRGRHNTQFGNPKDPAHFPFLYAYSPVHNVKPRTCYPSTLLTDFITFVVNQLGVKVPAPPPDRRGV